MKKIFLITILVYFIGAFALLNLSFADWVEDSESTSGKPEASRLIKRSLGKDYYLPLSELLIKRDTIERSADNTSGTSAGGTGENDSQDSSEQDYSENSSGNADNPYDPPIIEEDDGNDSEDVVTGVYGTEDDDKLSASNDDDDLPKTDEDNADLGGRGGKGGGDVPIQDGY